MKIVQAYGLCFGGTIERHYSNTIKFPAVAGQDYTGLPSTFSFVMGQSLSCIRIDIIDDSIVEDKETLSLTLQSLDTSPGVRISRGQSTVEITDNDGVFTHSCQNIPPTFCVCYWMICPSVYASPIVYFIL